MARGETMADSYERKMARIREIAEAGYLVTTEWECEWDRPRIVEQNPGLLVHPLVQHTPMRNCDALYGGRADAMRLHYKANDDETISYVDVMSLYPYICIYGKFPVGHPTIHAGDLCKDIAACLLIDGLIKCSVVPPQQMYHPVLPFRNDKKLLFSLCRTCFYERNTSTLCHHTIDAKRTLTGTWVIDEVHLAVTKDYRILEIIEV